MKNPPKPMRRQDKVVMRCWRGWGTAIKNLGVGVAKGIGVGLELVLVVLGGIERLRPAKGY
jgi:hypothetical protein